MFSLTDSIGKPLFETISITLVCGLRLAKTLARTYENFDLLLFVVCRRMPQDRATRGVHAQVGRVSAPDPPFAQPRADMARARRMPRWLSSQKMEVVKSLLADDPVRNAVFQTILLSCFVSSHTMKMPSLAHICFLCLPNVHLPVWKSETIYEPHCVFDSCCLQAMLYALHRSNAVLFPICIHAHF